MQNIFDSCAYEDQRLLTLLYAQSHRWYHNAAHAHHVARYCLEKETKHNGVPSNQIFYNVAAAFHDAVYDVGKTDNEEKSALLFERSATGTKVISTYEIAKAIRATKNHFDPANAELSDRIQNFLDADLYELGSEWELFDHNSQNIEREYRTHFDEQSFLLGRKSWLETTLTHKHIYWINRGRDKKAFHNIQRSLDELNTRLERTFGIT